ncbi:hypothetical protein N7519_003921, partial [Penicillium mononematosum]|uniref:uncharacterized protein n=1 Tax=Penicillium mononematosum TaxID=268346 RepID=UPI002547321C
EDSLVVTHPTTNSPACGLSTAERTGSPVFHTLWSYVLGYVWNRIIIRIGMPYYAGEKGRLLEQLISKKANTEALHVVSRALPKDMSWSNCTAGNGTYFPGCVRIPSESGKAGECGNCHFGGQGRRCSLKTVTPQPHSSASAQKPCTPNQPVPSLDQEEPNAPDNTRLPSSPGRHLTEPLAQNVSSEAIVTLELCILGIDTDIVSL